jgi:hypothetical protein
MQEPADYLFAEGNANVYAILDGASVRELLDRLHRFKPEFVCLYRGELEPDLVHVAPYLVRLERKSAFTDWIFERGWGNHWGVFAVAPSDLTAMRQHFRRFLTVHDSEGSPMLFRYYDPRVLRTYLPTCSTQELGEVFGPVLHYVVEGEEPMELLRFQFAGGALVRSLKKLNEKA